MGGLDRVLRWRAEHFEGIEHAVTRTGPGGLEVESVLVGELDGTPFGLNYALTTDDEWHTTRFTLQIPLGESLELLSDGNGHWTKDGIALPDLDGCLDVDFSMTPVSNVLPIRRLALETGDSEVIRAAYVSFPDGSVTVDEQRYTRLGPSAYRYEAVDGTFARDIEVDDEGFVVDYPGLFHRIR